MMRRLGVATVTTTGRGAMMCCMLLEDGAGVGGAGVESGGGALVWLIDTGMMKSYEATSVGWNLSSQAMVCSPPTVTLYTPGFMVSSDSVKGTNKIQQSVAQCYFKDVVDVLLTLTPL